MEGKANTTIRELESNGLGDQQVRTKCSIRKKHSFASQAHAVFSIPCSIFNIQIGQTISCPYGSSCRNVKVENPPFAADKLFLAPVAICLRCIVTCMNDKIFRLVVLSTREIRVKDRFNTGSITLRRASVSVGIIVACSMSKNVPFEHRWMYQTCGEL
jgi:hypothetical protein